MTFRFRPGLALATFVALAILCALGTWQLQRRAWKEALVVAVETRAASAPISFDEALSRASKGDAVEYQPVFLEGVYDHAREAHVFAARDGVAGYYVFTPLTRAGAADVYVNRGFTPDARKSEAARVDGAVRVAGILRAPQRPTAMERLVAAKDQPEDNLYFARDPRRFDGAASAAPLYVESDGRENAADLPAPALSRADFPNRHLEYALTWYGLAAALLGVYLAYSIKR
jgi:surfeit locus 1 family protein